MKNNASNGNGLAELERRLWSAADQLWANSPLRLFAEQRLFCKGGGSRVHKQASQYPTGAAERDETRLA
jgi:hypothetical protein